jgi:hypothetical protein
MLEIAATKNTTSLDQFLEWQFDIDGLDASLIYVSRLSGALDDMMLIIKFH